MIDSLEFTGFLNEGYPCFKNGVPFSVVRLHQEDGLSCADFVSVGDLIGYERQGSLYEVTFVDPLTVRMIRKS